MEKHKSLGQIFTPEWIVEEILNSVGFIKGNILNKKIIDPASGDGAFLKIIIKRIIDEGLENGLSDKEIISILEKDVYGIEIDKKEFLNCIDNLNNIVDSLLGKDKKVDWKIYNDNTLHKYKEFIGFFDFVVGNPPYIRIHNLDEETRNILKREFIFSEGTIDIYLSFFELGFKLLKKDGILGYITPNSYLHNSSYVNFRKHLADKKAVRMLIDFKANKIFNNVGTYTAITIIDFSDNKVNFDYKELIDGKIKKINEIEHKDLNHKDWSFSSKEDMNFLKDLYSNSNKKISDFFDVQYGFATLRDKIFIGNIKEEKGNMVLFNDRWIEKDILFKIVKGSTYKGNSSKFQYIIFPYKKENNRFTVISESELKNKYPKTYEYLSENKEELLKRDLDKGASWYEFGRSQGLQTSHNEKIVISTLMKDNIFFHKLDENVFVYSGIYIIKKKNESNWEIIKNVLSSDEFAKYIKITGKDFSGGYKSITSNQIKNYPTKETTAQKGLF